MEATTKQKQYIADLCGEKTFEQCWRKLQALGWSSSACKRPSKAQASKMIDELKAAQ